MGIHFAYHASISPSVPLKCFGAENRKVQAFSSQFSSIGNTARASYNSLVSEDMHALLQGAFSANYAYSAAIIIKGCKALGATGDFRRSKLDVVFMGKGLKSCSAIIPRAYILFHRDFTANLTLTILNVIDHDQLKGWYNNDDVVAEWKKVKETMFPNVHCFVSGPNLSLDLAADFRYHVFSKELPLVLKAVLHGDSAIFAENPELMDALGCVYFHSSLPKYNRIECWGPLKEAAEGKPGDRIQGMLAADKEVHHHRKNGEEVQNPSSKHCLPFFFDLYTGQAGLLASYSCNKNQPKPIQVDNNTIKEQRFNFKTQIQQEQSTP